MPKPNQKRHRNEKKTVPGRQTFLVWLLFFLMWKIDTIGGPVQWKTLSWGYPLCSKKWFLTKHLHVMSWEWELVAKHCRAVAVSSAAGVIDKCPNRVCVCTLHTL